MIANFPRSRQQLLTLLQLRDIKRDHENKLRRDCEREDQERLRRQTERVVRISI